MSFFSHLLFAGKVTLHHVSQPCFGLLPVGPDTDNHLRAPEVHSLGTAEDKSHTSSGTHGINSGHD